MCFYFSLLTCIEHANTIGLAIFYKFYFDSFPIIMGAQNRFKSNSHCFIFLYA
jgi:hypothetical protein